jgi:hypothetical protein
MGNREREAGEREGGCLKAWGRGKGRLWNSFGASSIFSFSLFSFFSFYAQFILA